MSKISHTRSYTYQLIDANQEEITGRFYEAEMQRAKFPAKFLIEEIGRKRKDGKVHVKWYGKSERTWENEKDLDK